MRIKRDFKRKWTEALRSGKYEQCTGYLHRQDNGYCCLGVACDLAPDAVWIEAVYEEDDGDQPPMYTDERYGGAQELPGGSGWQALTGFDEGDPEVHLSLEERQEFMGRWKVKHTTVMPEGFRITLAQMNDVGYTFGEIADVIDRHFTDEVG